jgi:hypothetical protein
MKRIFIDSDVVHRDEVGTAIYTIELIMEKQGLDVPVKMFDEIVDFAWHEADKAWESVKSSDEIYANTSLVPLCGYGSYTGSVVVMDVMMKKAIDENVTGKSLFILRPFDDVEWDGIDLSLMPKAFLNNKLFTLEDHDRFVEVDIESLINSFNLED